MLQDTSPMPFGPYRYRQMREVPADYLLGRRGDTNLEVRHYIESNLNVLIARRDGIIPAPEPVALCPKIPYATREEAKRRLGEIAGMAGDHKKPCRCYECPDCGFWHHTSTTIEQRQRSLAYFARLETQAMNAAPTAG